jgi:hypothetical protein
MIALEVTINGKRRCIASVGDGSVGAHLSWVVRTRRIRGFPMQEGKLDVGGIDSHRRGFPSWLREKVRLGDEVLIRVVEVPKGDRPAKLVRGELGPTTRSQKTLVRQLAKEFGWKIVTK